MFEISLSVEILGFYEANTVGFRAIEENEVAGKVFPFWYLYNLSNSQLSPPDKLKTFSHGGVFISLNWSQDFFIVFPTVGKVSFEILINILDHGNSDYEGKRENHWGVPLRVRNGFVELHYHHYQIVKVHELAELFMQVSGKECYEVVFSGSYFIIFVNLFIGLKWTIFAANPPPFFIFSPHFYYPYRNSFLINGSWGLIRHTFVSIFNFLANLVRLFVDIIGTHHLVAFSAQKYFCFSVFNQGLWLTPNWHLGRIIFIDWVIKYYLVLMA